MEQDHLSSKRCRPCEGKVPALTQSEVQHFLSRCPGWNVNSDYTEIHKDFEFKGYYKTIAFVNAIAWIAQNEGHHPDLEVSYNRCIVRYSTHAIQGLSENDFICAAKVDALTS